MTILFLLSCFITVFAIDSGKETIASLCFILDIMLGLSMILF